MNPVCVRKGLSGLHQRGVNMAASAHFRVYDRMILKLTIAALCSPPPSLGGCSISTKDRKCEARLREETRLCQEPVPERM